MTYPSPPRGEQRFSCSNTALRGHMVEQTALISKGVSLLTKQHLSLFRAALRYFEDELCPHGSAGQQSYFDEPLQAVWTADEVQSLREWLRTCELKYASYDPRAMTLKGGMLSDSPEQARTLSENQKFEIASLLLGQTDQ